MKANKADILYWKCNPDVEYIIYKNSLRSYPTHTHAGHITLGYVLDGAVSVGCGTRKAVYHTGESFRVLPDTPHEIEPVCHKPYSMVTACIPVRKVPESSEEIHYTKRLKQTIRKAPEDKLAIEDMARSIGINPYHLIRQFRTVCGLTPHQFQIQCRVRKAQRLLENGKSVTEAAYDAGFCDQSHLDRCFRKVVGLTPNEYRQSVMISA